MCRAVDQRTVDQHLVTALPQADTDEPREPANVGVSVIMSHWLCLLLLMPFRRILMRLDRVAMPEPLRAMEGHEDHPERIERGHEHTAQHAEVGVTRTPAMRLADGLDDGVLRIE